MGTFLVITNTLNFDGYNRISSPCINLTRQTYNGVPLLKTSYIIRVTKICSQIVFEARRKLARFLTIGARHIRLTFFAALPLFFSLPFEN